MNKELRIGLCGSCHCMTKTMQKKGSSLYYCGKCKKTKVSPTVSNITDMKAMGLAYLGILILTIVGIKTGFMLTDEQFSIYALGLVFSIVGIGGTIAFIHTKKSWGKLK